MPMYTKSLIVLMSLLLLLHAVNSGIMSENEVPENGFHGEDRGTSEFAMEKVYSWKFFSCLVLQ